MTTTELPTTDFADRRDDYRAPNCVTRGSARSSSFAPDGYSLWQVDGVLDVGTELEWSDDHGDEAVYVVSGAVEIDGSTVGAGGVVIVEAGVPAVLRALQTTHVEHFGPSDHEPPGAGIFGPPERDGRCVHTYASVSATRQAPRLTTKELAGSYYGDGTCRTCRITLYEADGRSLTDFAAPSHLHSEDEIIHVLDGTLQFGRFTITPGMSVAVPAQRRYSFRTKDGFRFLNYRRDASTVLRSPGSPPVLETVDGMVAHHASAGA